MAWCRTAQPQNQRLVYQRFSLLDVYSCKKTDYSPATPGSRGLVFGVWDQNKNLSVVQCTVI